MTRKTAWKGAVLSLVCFLLAVCCIVPSIRGILTSIAQQIVGQDVRYFNNELQNDGIDTNNYNFGYDRKAAADADVKAGKVGSVVDWVAKKDGTGDFFYSISVDPALCAAVALHMDETLVLPEKILVDEESVVIGQRADKAHLHFLSSKQYWDRAVSLITKYLTSGSIEVKYIKKSPKSMMYMQYNGLEGNKPSVIVRNTNSSKGYVVVFDLGKPGSVRFRLNCGYQPIDVGYWPTPTPVPPGPEPEPEPEPTPTPTLEPKDPDAGPQAQLQQHPETPGYEDFGGGPNHDPDTTLTEEEPVSPESYAPPAPPTAAPTEKPTAPPATPTPKPHEEVVIGDGQQHGDLAQIQEEQHSEQTVEEPLAEDGENQGDLDPDAVE
jgi:hypothetical protein